MKGLLSLKPFSGVKRPYASALGERSLRCAPAAASMAVHGAWSHTRCLPRFDPRLLSIMVAVRHSSVTDALHVFGRRTIDLVDEKQRKNPGPDWWILPGEAYGMPEAKHAICRYASDRRVLSADLLQSVRAALQAIGAVPAGFGEELARLSRNEKRDVLWPPRPVSQRPIPDLNAQAHFDKAVRQRGHRYGRKNGNANAKPSLKRAAPSITLICPHYPPHDDGMREVDRIRDITKIT